MEQANGLARYFLSSFRRIGRTTFHLVALDEHGKVVIKKKFSLKQLLAYTANLPHSLIGINGA